MVLSGGRRPDAPVCLGIMLANFISGDTREGYAQHRDKDFVIWVVV